jgi:RNA polymerase sigma factor (TIGR02999 family)
MSDSGTPTPAQGTGQAQTPDELLTSLYQELRQLAAQKMAREGPGQTLQATALVHEAWLRLGGEAQTTWQNQGHFFGAAAEAMRRILIEKARRRSALRRGGQAERVEFDDAELAVDMPDEQLLALHEALERFAQRDHVKAELVKLKFFAGLTLEEAARVLGVSTPTAKRYWAYARAWLYREISGVN